MGGGRWQRLRQHPTGFVPDVLGNGVDATRAGADRASFRGLQALGFSGRPANPRPRTECLVLPAGAVACALAHRRPSPSICSLNRIPGRALRLTPNRRWTALAGECVPLRAGGPCLRKPYLCVSGQRETVSVSAALENRKPNPKSPRLCVGCMFHKAAGYCAPCWHPLSQRGLCGQIRDCFGFRTGRIFLRRVAKQTGAHHPVYARDG